MHLPVWQGTDRHGRTPRKRRSIRTPHKTVSPVRKAICQRRRDGRRIPDPPVLASALDALVAVLVQVDEILPQLLLPLLHDVAVFDVLETVFEAADRRAVEFVLVRFQVA